LANNRTKFFKDDSKYIKLINSHFIHECVVPIYDSHEIERGVGETIVELCYSGQVPLYTKGDVPNDHFVMVGYTVNCYPGKKVWLQHISCNVQFVVLPGDPL
jgi:hypothetical protein